MEQDVEKLCAKTDELIKKLDDIDNFQAYRLVTLVAFYGTRDTFLKERLAKERYRHEDNRSTISALRFDLSNWRSFCFGWGSTDNFRIVLV